MKNPLVSHSQLEARLANRSVVSLKDIRSRHHGIGLGPSWATICAVGEISDTREASSGNLYSIWKLTDLKDTSVSLFLFGRAHSDLTGEVQPGSVVAILSAKVREGRELDLSVDNADQVLVLGTASEFGYCKAKNHVRYINHATEQSTPCLSATVQ